MREISDIDEFYKTFDKKYLYCGGFMESALQIKLNELQNKFKEILLKFKPVKKHWFKKNMMCPVLIGNSKFDFAKDIIENELKYRKLYELLEDEISKKTLLAVMCFKLTQNYQYVKQIERFTIDQYFDPEIIKFNPEGEVFADCGGFSGDTAIAAFRLRVPIKRYYFIEPDPENFKNAKNALKNFENIIYCECASGDSKGEVAFECRGAGGHITLSGTKKIIVDTLDNIVKEPLTFIKMDIEGAESATLKGAENHILNHKPKLAVCAYHKPDDAHKLAFQIKKIRPDYKLFFRVYGSSYCEAVIYAL